MPIIDRNTPRWIAVPVMLIVFTLVFGVIVGAFLALPSNLFGSTRSSAQILAAWAWLGLSLGCSIFLTVVVLRDHRTQTEVMRASSWTSRSSELFGDFEVNSKGTLWRTSDIEAGARCFKLWGSAPEPSSADFELWTWIESRLEQIIEVVRFHFDQIPHEIPFQLTSLGLKPDSGTYELHFFLLPPHRGDLFPTVTMDMNMRIVESDCSP
jgi:hypothetical protein